VSPLPAIFALGNARVHVRSTNIEAPVNKQFSVMTTLYVPYIYPDNGHVGLWRDFDYSWSGCKRNIVEDVILFEDGFNI